MAVEQGVQPSGLVARSRIDRCIPRLSGPMDAPSWLQTICSVRLVSLRHAYGVVHGIIVHTRSSEIRRSEDQASDRSCKREAGLFLNNKREEVVGGMLLMQEFRARFKEQGSSFNLRDQAGRRLMTLEYVVVVGQSVDIGQSGTLREKIANGNLVSAFDV